MTIFKNFLYSVIVILAGLSVESLRILPPKWAAIAIPALMLVQGLISLRAHKFNPDGTPAEKPYDPTGNGMILPRKGGDDGFLG